MKSHVLLPRDTLLVSFDIYAAFFMDGQLILSQAANFDWPPRSWRSKTSLQHREFQSATVCRLQKGHSYMQKR